MEPRLETHQYDVATVGRLTSLFRRLAAFWARLFPCPPEIRSEVEKRQVGVLLQQSGPIAIISLLCAACLVAALWGHANAWILSAWTVIAGSASLVRLRHWIAWRSERQTAANPNHVEFLRRFRRDAVLLSAIWAFVPLALFVPNQVEAQVVLAVVLAGIVAGLVALTAAVPFVSTAFALIVLPVFQVQQLIEGTRGGYVLAAACLVFYFGIYIALRSGHDGFIGGVAAGERAERAEKRLRDSIASLNDGFVLYGPDRRCVLYNAQFCDMFGLWAEDGDLTGRHAEELVRLSVARGIYADDPEIMSDPEAWIRARMGHMSEPPCEPQERRLAGGRIVLAQSHVLPDGSSVGLFTDITRQKRAEQRLIDAIESLDDAFVLYGPDERVVVHNRRLVEFYHFMKPLPSVVGMSYEELNRLAVASRFAVYPEAYEDTETWVRERLAQFRAPSHEPFERRLPNGRHLYLRQYRLADGSTVGIHTDVTALKRAEQRLADALDSLPDACVLWDAQDRLALHNRAYAQMFASVPGSTAIGERFEDILAACIAAGAFPEAKGREAEFAGERLRQHREPGGAVLQRLAGDRWVRLSERRTSDGGIVGMRTDVTETVEREAALRKSRQELAARVEELESAKFKLQGQSVELRLLFRQLSHARDEAQAANRAKSLFLANMSHELRTPLNAIIGFTEVMQAQLFGPLGDKRYEGYTGDVLGAARHLLKLINDILDISKIEAGKWELRDEVVHVPAVFAEAVRLCKGRDEADALTIGAELPPDLPDLRADERALKQIVINALSNSVKFTPGGGRIRLRARMDGAGQMHIAIADTGIGMRREDLPRALAPFSQIDNRIARRHDGTGLGLSIAKALAERHGARLRIRSRPNRGTVVVVTLPRQRVLAGQVSPLRRHSARAA